MKAQECTATKVCTECGKRKPLDSFYTRRKTHKCKKCELIASQARYQRRKDAVLERCAEYREANKDRIKEYLAEWYVKNKKRVLKRCKVYNRKPEVKRRESERHKARWIAVRESLLAKRKA